MKLVSLKNIVSLFTALTLSYSGLASTDEMGEGAVNATTNGSTIVTVKKVKNKHRVKGRRLQFAGPPTSGLPYGYFLTGAFDSEGCPIVDFNQAQNFNKIYAANPWVRFFLNVCIHTVQGTNPATCFYEDTGYVEECGSRSNCFSDTWRPDIGTYQPPLIKALCSNICSNGECISDDRTCADSTAYASKTCRGIFPTSSDEDILENCGEFYGSQTSLVFPAALSLLKTFKSIAADPNAARKAAECVMGYLGDMQSGIPRSFSSAAERKAFYGQVVEDIGDVPGLAQAITEHCARRVLRKCVPDSNGIGSANFDECISTGNTAKSKMANWATVSCPNYVNGTACFLSPEISQMDVPSLCGVAPTPSPTMRNAAMMNGLDPVAQVLLVLVVYVMAFAHHGQ